jgi:putative heme iron utilization protein
MTQDDFQSPRSLARFILRESLFGTLGTTSESGHPFVALVPMSSMTDGSPAMLLANAARHTHNLRKDPRVSLLLVEKPQAEDPTAVARLTVSGIVEPLDKEHIRARYLMRHPRAAKLLDTGDYGFWRLTVERGHLVAAFGKMSDLSVDELTGPLVPKSQPA